MLYHEENPHNNFSQPLSFTLFTGATNSRCTKSFHNTQNGIQKESAPMFSSSKAQKIDIQSLEELKGIFSELKSNQCISTGVFDQTECQVILKAKLSDELEAEGYRSRSKQHMKQPKAGLIMIDYDLSSNMPEALKCTSPQEVMNKLIQAAPELGPVGYAATTSSSVGVYSSDTPDSCSRGGFHIYLVAENINLNELQKTLEIKLWNAGLGYIQIAKNGTLLNRTLIDLSVFSPERIIYEAAPVLDDGLSQLPRQWNFQKGSALQAIPVISDDEETKYKQSLKDARQTSSIQEKAQKIKQDYISTQVTTYADKYQISSDEATQLISDQISRLESQSELILTSEHRIYVDSTTQLSVRELIEQEKSYEGIYIPDPIEGPEHGLSKAVFSNIYRPKITSFAHGQITVYELCEFAIVSKEEMTPFLSSVADSEQVEDKPKLPIHPFAKFSLTGKSAELEQQLENTAYVLPHIALKGQATVIFAQPNTGKTLLTLKLLTDAIEEGFIDPSKTFYINADDHLRGLTQKLKLSEEYGFEMLAPGHNGFQSSNLLTMITELSNENNCRGTIIILDTLKKFMDLMSKTVASHFWMIMRVFISKGGTLIGLAHANKNRSGNDKIVYAGTSDTVDDVDCVFMLDTLETNNRYKVVEFENTKNRGEVANKLAFEYSVTEGDSYDARLASVQEVDSELASQLRSTEDIDTNEEDNISEIIKCISMGSYSKMALATAVSENTGLSKRKSIGLIEKYTGVDIKVHKWNFKRIARGRQIYTLLEIPVKTPTQTVN